MRANQNPFAPQITAKKKNDAVGVYDKGTPEFNTKHNIHNPELLSFVERLENISDEIQAIQDDRKELLAEIKVRGFDAPTVKELLKFRKDKEKYQEKIGLVGAYALGIGEHFEIPGFEPENIMPMNVSFAFAADKKSENLEANEQMFG